MTSERMVSRCLPALLGAGLAVAVAAFSGEAGAQQPPPPSGATVSPEDLKAARELFQDAYKDEQEKHFEQALEKFRRVAAVKESASVRYRIGSVLESLGRYREARDAFRALAASKASLPANEQEIATSAAERAHALDGKIPKLVIRLQDNPPADTRVTIDGAPVPASTAARAIELDPGEHVVQATSPTSKPYESKVMLNEGGETPILVGLVPLDTTVTPPPAQEPEKKPNTLAYVALGAGGVLLVTGVVLLLVREGKISDLESACPNGLCPASRQSELESTRDSAELFGPLGFTLGAVGVAAAGVGVYLLVRKPKTQDPSANGPSTTPAPNAGLRIAPMSVRGGAMLGVGATF